MVADADVKTDGRSEDPENRDDELALGVRFGDDEIRWIADLVGVVRVVELGVI